MIVAIDGPASSGKSTTAKLLAKQLGYTYLDTGAMYRAVALAVIRSETDTADGAALRSLLRNTQIDVFFDPAGNRLHMNDKDVTDAIRSEEVTSVSSTVGAISIVREKLVEEQRRIAGEQVRAGKGAVVDGRDIGTVVFPDADVKIFMTADVDTRAARRFAELAEKGISTTLADVREAIVGRDKLDQTRTHSPLKMAPDAIRLDTSGMSLDEQVARVVKLVREAVPSPAK